MVLWSGLSSGSTLPFRASVVLREEMAVPHAPGKGDSVTQEPVPITILLVEDDPGHARLIEKNLRRSEVTNQIVHLGDGQTAVDYLFGEGEYIGQERPGRILVLLDLNLPGLDGYQVLRRVKKDPMTQRIPIVVLTTTEDSREVARCYDLGCTLFVTKPVNYEEFTETLRRLGQELSIVKVPNGD